MQPLRHSFRPQFPFRDQQRITNSTPVAGPPGPAGMGLPVARPF